MVKDTNIHISNNYIDKLSYVSGIIFLS